MHGTDCTVINICACCVFGRIVDACGVLGEGLVIPWHKWQ